MTRTTGTSAKAEVPDFTAKIGRSVKGMKIALPQEFFADGINEEIKASVLKAADEYKSMGAEIVECKMPSLKYAVPAYYLLACAEAASNLSRYDLGNYALSSGYYDAYYRKALALRQLIRNEYSSIFEKCDVILTPTTPTTAYTPEMTSDPVQMYQADICTVTVKILQGFPLFPLPADIIRMVCLSVCQ